MFYKHYFRLQYRFLNRKISDFGLSPAIGYLLVMLVFAGVSVYLVNVKHAVYLYVLIAILLMSKLSENSRNEFLKLHFGNVKCRIIRLAENMLIALPFAGFLAFRQEFFPLISLLFFAGLMAIVNFQNRCNISIPTPFGKNPFEFTVGFRNTFFMFFIAYTIAIIAVNVDNFNLGIFSLALVFLTISTFYIKPENDFLVWIHNFSPAKFLIEKIKTSIVFSSFLCAPIVLLLSTFYFNNICILLIFTLLGYLFLCMMILAKYASWAKTAQAKPRFSAVLAV